jgi:chromosome segregation ATPase
LLEQAIVFGIGFLSAALIAIVIIPPISRRATRLSEARQQSRSAQTESQAAADRDALRAQHAVDLVRAEKRVAAAQEFGATLRAEIGRMTIETMELDTLVAKQIAEIGEQRLDIERRHRENDELQGAFGAGQIALLDLSVQRDRAAENEAASLRRTGHLEAQGARDRARIAILTARAEKLEERLSDMSRAATETTKTNEAERDQFRTALGSQVAQFRELERRWRELTTQHDSFARDLAGRNESLAQTRRQLAEMDARLTESERRREDALVENGRHFAAIAERDAALKKSKEAHEALAAEIAAFTAAAWERENASDLERQSLKTTLATTEGSLGAVRADREALLSEQDNLRKRLTASVVALSRAEGDLEILRKAIDRFGREFARQYRSASSKGVDFAGSPANAFPAKRRDPPSQTPSGPAPASAVQSFARSDEPIATK